MILFKNAKVLSMATNDLDNGCVLVENGKISKIAKDIEAKPEYKVIDCQGRYLMPGMVDAHCHVGLFGDGIGFEGLDVNEMTEPVTPHMRAIDGINPMDRTMIEACEGGVTCASTGPGSANVIGGQFCVLKTYGNRVDDMIIDEYNAMKCAFGENPKRVYNGKGKSPMTRMATAAILRETLHKARTYMAKKEKGLEDPTKAPDYDIRLEPMIRVLKREVPLKAHAHRADDILTALRIAKEFDVDVTIEHCTEGHLIADHLAKENARCVVGPSFGHRSKFELQNMTFETPGILSKKGVKVAIMTDSPIIPLHYLRLCAGLAHNSGMDEMEALKAITIYAAEILGLDQRLGSVEVGKDADLIVFDGHPFETLSNCVMTMIDGNIVYQRS